MILSGASLFLLGTLVSAGPFLPSIPTEIVISKHKHGSHDRAKLLPSSSRSSIIENYIQEGTNVFFKPQFMLSADKMPPQVQSLIAAVKNDDCKTDYPLVAPVVVDEPLRVVEQEISGPFTKIEQITEIKPAEEISSLLEVYPKPELVTLVEEVKPLSIPEPPRPFMFEIPEKVFMEIEEPKKPVVIPPAPVLPPMELPKLPTLLVETPVVAEEPVYVEIEEANKVEVPVVIPPAPVLRPIELPVLEKEELVAEFPCEHQIPITTVVEIEKPGKLPLPVEVTMVEDKNEYEVPLMIPPGPVLPPLERPNFEVMVEETVLPYEHNPVIVEVEESKEIKVIPPGPVLPPMEIPKLPLVVENVPIDAELPCEPLVPVVPPVFVEMEEPNVIIEETEVVGNQMQNIPPAPVLAPLEIPKLPIIVEEKHIIESENNDIPCPPEQPILTLQEMHQPLYIEQNRFFVPSSIAHIETSKLPIEIPSIPQYIISSIPNFERNKDCVDDIVIERVLPKMRKDMIYERPVPHLVPVL